MKLLFNIGLTFLLFINISYSQTIDKSVVKKLTVSQCKEDLDFLSCLIELVHPSPYRYISPDSLKATFKTVNNSLSDSETQIEFYLAVKKILSRIRCVHTDGYLPDSVKQKFNAHLLPFEVSISNDRVFVSKYIKSPAGTMPYIRDEIISIDGIPIKTILGELRAVLPSDGTNNAYKDNALENGAFNTLFNYIYGRKVQYNVTFLDHGVRQNIILNAAYNLPAKRPLPSLSNPHISCIDSTSRVYSLTIPNFDYANYESVNKTLISRLRDLNPQRLVIDVTNNGGGNPLAAIDLLAYIIAKPFYFIGQSDERIDFTNLREIIESGSVVDCKKLSSLSMKKKVKQPELQKLQPSKYVLKVPNLYLITNGGTVSTAVYFAVVLKKFSACKMVGEETGGNKCGTNGGYIAHLTLPHSRIKVDIPTIFTKSCSDEIDNGRGLIPDIPLEPQKMQNQRYLRAFFKGFL